MATTSSVYTYNNECAGKLPKGALTEWLIADADSSEELEVDSCDVLVGKGKGRDPFNVEKPEYTETRRIPVANPEATTNRKWAELFVRDWNRKRPDNPVYIHTSRNDSRFICVCKVYEHLKS